MFFTFIKALPQFLPFLLTLLRGEKAPMSGEQSKTGKRIAFLIAVLSLIGTGLLYFDHAKLETMHQADLKTMAAQKAKIEKYEKEGVEGLASRERMQKIKEETLMKEVQLKQKDEEIARLNTVVDTIQAENKALLTEKVTYGDTLASVQAELTVCQTKPSPQCPDNIPKTPSPVAKDELGDFLKELNKVGKKDGN